MHFNLVNTIIILLLTKDMIVSDHNNSCWGTNISAWAQTCLGTILSGHNRVWAQSCGPSRVGPIMYGHKRGGTIVSYFLPTHLFSRCGFVECRPLAGEFSRSKDYS